ncbi:MAG: hypothetical protein R2697_18745 [Ilumatobacteraceae bacterium]
MFLRIVYSSASDSSAAIAVPPRGDARGVHHRQVVLVADRVQRQHLDLAALVLAEGAVPPGAEGDARRVLDGGDDLGLVLDRAAVDHHVAVELGALGDECVDGEDVPACCPDLGCQSAEYARHVVERHLEMDRVLGGGRP